MYHNGRMFDGKYLLCHFGSRFLYTLCVPHLPFAGTPQKRVLESTLNPIMAFLQCFITFYLNESSLYTVNWMVNTMWLYTPWSHQHHTLLLSYARIIIIHTLEWVMNTINLFLLDFGLITSTGVIITYNTVKYGKNSYLLYWCKVMEYTS